MAKPINVINADITIQAYGDAGALVGTAVDLCGANAITWEAGTPDEVDITSFCDTSKVNESGMMNEGTVDITYVTYDPTDLGQALIDSSPLNTRFQLTVEFAPRAGFTTGAKIVFETRKKQETSGSITLSDTVLNGSHQLALIGKPVFTPAVPSS